MKCVEVIPSMMRALDKGAIIAAHYVDQRRWRDRHLAACSDRLVCSERKPTDSSPIWNIDLAPGELDVAIGQIATSCAAPGTTRLSILFEG
jgi:hypothetical protein